MSDMHDGIGGQLITTLSLVEHGDASKEDVSAASASASTICG